jgi:hypothetical protein
MNGGGGDSARASARTFGFNPRGVGGEGASENATLGVVIYEPSGREAATEGTIKSNFYGVTGSELIFADMARPRQAVIPPAKT